MSIPLIEESARQTFYVLTGFFILIYALILLQLVASKSMRDYFRDRARRCWLACAPLGIGALYFGVAYVLGGHIAVQGLALLTGILLLLLLMVPLAD